MLPEGHYLCIDTATVFPQIGVFYRDEWLRFERFRQARAEVLWKSLKEWFPIYSWEGFVYNAGPGGTLGLHSALMMIRIWKTLVPYRSVPVGHYNGLAIASLLHPEHILVAQVRKGELLQARRGKLISVDPESTKFPPAALRFPSQMSAPLALQTFEVLDYDLSSAAALLFSSVQWDDAWRLDENRQLAAFVPWDGRRHGSTGSKI
jgi:hypothetical protein